MALILTTLLGAFNSSYGISDADRQLFYKVVEAEATGDGYDSKLAVANVICNRANNPAFPNTVKEVMLAKGQFSVISDGRYNKVKITESTRDAVDACLRGEWIISNKVTYFNAKRLNSWASRQKNYWGTIGCHDYFY